MLSLGIEQIRLFAGLHDDMTVEWYKDVGSNYVLTVALNAAIPVVQPLLNMAIASWKRFNDRGCSNNLVNPPFRSKALTQSDLDKKYIGPVFKLSLAYASTTTYITIALLLSAGLPILIPIMFICLAARYYLDKLYILKHYQSPPM